MYELLRNVHEGVSVLLSDNKFLECPVIVTSFSLPFPVSTHVICRVLASSRMPRLAKKPAPRSHLPLPYRRKLIRLLAINHSQTQQPTTQSRKSRPAAGTDCRQAIPRWKELNDVAMKTVDTGDAEMAAKIVMQSECSRVRNDVFCKIATTLSAAQDGNKREKNGSLDELKVQFLKLNL